MKGCDMQWYYLRGEQRLGPVEDAELERLAQTGQLAPTDFVWNTTMGAQWVQASTIASLVFVPQSVPPPPPPDFAPDAAAGPRGKTPNAALMRMARESLRNKWGLAVGVAILYLLLTVGISMGLNSISRTIGTLASWVIAGPMAVGFNMVFLSFARGRQASVEQLFYGFKIFGTALAAYLLMMIFIILWTLLLIIPGIIAAYSYSMTYFILADNPNIGPLEAITRSKEMMRGRKWKYFCLTLRFIGWGILCIFTCGIGCLWLVPYMQTSMAHFYEDVRLPRTGSV